MTEAVRPVLIIRPAVLQHDERVLVNVNKGSGDDTEKDSKSKDNEVTNPCSEGGLSSEEFVDSFVLGEWRNHIIPVSQVNE